MTAFCERVLFKVVVLLLAIGTFYVFAWICDEWVAAVVAIVLWGQEW